MCLQFGMIFVDDQLLIYSKIEVLRHLEFNYSFGDCYLILTWCNLLAYCRRTWFCIRRHGCILTRTACLLRIGICGRSRLWRVAQALVSPTIVSFASRVRSCLTATCGLNLYWHRSCFSARYTLSSECCSLIEVGHWCFGVLCLLFLITTALFFSLPMWCEAAQFASQLSTTTASTHLSLAYLASILE